MRQLAHALVYIHLNCVFHRDIKVDNLLLSKGKEIKLADFGLAILVESNAASAMPTKKGTDKYFSPEKARASGRYEAGKSDMWAAGCVLVELVACERLPGPLWDDGPEGCAKRGAWIKRAESASPLLGQVARGLLELCPEQRLSAEDMLTVLKGGSAAQHSSPAPSQLQVRSAMPDGRCSGRAAHFRTPILSPEGFSWVSACRNHSHPSPHPSTFKPPTHLPPLALKPVFARGNQSRLFLVLDSTLQRIIFCKR